MLSFFLGEDFPGDEDEDDELAQQLLNREPSETEPAVFLTQTDYNAAISWVFFQ